MRSARAAHFLDQVDDLPSVPVVYQRVKALLDDSESPLDDIAREMAHDTAMTARLLRVANSAMYGVARKIATPMQAIAIVGLAQIQHLVLATTVTSAFAHIAPPLMDMQRFWNASLYRAVAARALAREARLGEWERLFTTGLLSDIGHLVLYMVAPLEAEEALARATREARSREETERELLGFDHADVSGALAAKWMLPLSMEACLQFHMRPLGAHPYTEDACVVHTAARLADTRTVNTMAGGNISAGISTNNWPVMPEVLDALALDATRLPDILERIDGEFNELATLLLDNAPLKRRLH